jgi:alginate production protein
MRSNRQFSLLLVAIVSLGSTVHAQSIVPAPQSEEPRVDGAGATQPFTLNAFSKLWRQSGSWEYGDEQRDNFDLNDARLRDRRIREHTLKIETQTQLTPDTELYLQAKGVHESRRTEGTAGTERSKALERGQTWVKFARLGETPWALQVGRVELVDRRAWWWDDELDAARLLYSSGTWRLDTGLAREVARASSLESGIAPKVQGVTRWFGQATWQHAPRHTMDFFWLHARDNSARPAARSVVANEDASDPSDLTANWIGLRASGELRANDGPRLSYWADTAVLRGREALTEYTEGGSGQFTAASTSTRPLRGQAIDIGATGIFPVVLRPSFTIGYARGSGGQRSAALDANFRQTGLQENKARIAGVKRLRMYGELLQPELSNLAVSTLGLGVRVLNNSSVELIGHRYRQPVPSSVLPGSRLGTDPQGISGDIGRELDLVVALREWRQLELTLKWSVFKPGAAFAANRRDAAHAIEIGASVNF